MKLNNRGFAISSILYIILIMAVILVSLTLTILTSRKLIIDKTKEETLNKIYNRYELTYREVLKVLKEEIISYATDNNITKESIKIGDFNTSISEEIINGYKLDTKYLTVVSKNSNYDVYLGKKETITGNNKEVEDLVDIVDYKIEGNSYQKTYSGKNLFNINAMTGSGISINGVDVNVTIFSQNSSASTGVTLRELCPSLVVGETYIISYTSLLEDSYISIGSYATNNLWESGTSKTITETDLDSIVRMGRAGSGGSTITFSNIQVELGTKATEYEPYVGGKSSPNPQYPQEVLSVGDKITDDTSANYGKYNIPIRTGSKNLLDNTSLIASDTSNAKWEITETGFRQTKLSSGGYTKTTVYDITDIVKPNTKYYFHRDLDKNFVSIDGTSRLISGSLTLFIDDVQKTRLYSNQTDTYFTMPETFESVQIKTWTVVSDELTENFDSNTEYYLEWSNLYMGTEPYTEFVPYVKPYTTNIYLDNPLRKVGTKIDTMSLSSSNIKRNVGIAISKSTDNFYYTNQGLITNNLYRSMLGFKDASNYMVSGSNVPGYSNVLPSNKQRWNKWTEEQVHFGQANNAIYLIFNEEQPTLEDAYNYLSSNGTVEPYFIYQLNAEQTEEVSLPKINTSVGTQIISVGTDIKPSNVEFTVIKKIKQL